MCDAASLLKRKESFELLKQLPTPSNIWKYFLLCTETPRPSHKLDKFRSVLTNLAPLLDCEYKIDSAGNVRFRAKATNGFENAPKICIQSHMDMVTSANGDVSINFDTDPIDVFLTEKNNECWMQAKGTTLGADNGMGVATALAIFEDAKAGKFNHGQIEALFTADEETTMGGAENLDPTPFLDSDILLNVDSEEEYSICIGCAGGMENSFKLPIERSSSLCEKDFSFLHLHIKGLLGGHSGIEIHTGRANSLKCLNKLLRNLSRSIDNQLYIISFNGGGAPNVIPREAEATIAVPSNLLSNVKDILHTQFENMKESFLSVEHRMIDGIRKSVMVLDMNQLDSKPNQDPLSLKSTEKLLDSIEQFHSGVIRMNFDVADLVETSINLSNVNTLSDHVSFYSFARSSSNNALDQVQDSLEAFGRLTGSSVSSPLNKFPGWDPKIDSLSLTEMKEAHMEVMKKDARIYAVHAGLECGLIQAVYPDISCISVGPEIHHAHSPDECLLVPSVKRYYDLVIRFIERIANTKQ